jgi:hypothetical protein
VELYTSLTRLKMAMNGGIMPPMTKLSEQALKLIDPAFTIGMGALEEDAVKGLRCPVRGCGQYYHALGYHLSRTHRAIGGLVAVREALGIPACVPFLSISARLAFAKRSRPLTSQRPPEQDRKAIAQVCRATKLSANGRNLRDRCEEQLRQKFTILELENGRAPSMREAKERFGWGFVAGVQRIYGTWRNALGQFGMSALTAREVAARRLVSREATLDGLRAWYEVHGDLPTSDDANRRDRFPLIPSSATIRRAMGCAGWDEAMRRAAALLNIYGGRYGLPESARPKKAS